MPAIKVSGPVSPDGKTLSFETGRLAPLADGAVVAIAPGVVSGLGIDLTPLRVEAILLSLLVFLGVNVAWLLMFDEPEPD